jgi:fermentation-respiration switch protein FrsA (DUF1100 family)
MLRALRRILVGTLVAAAVAVVVSVAWLARDPTEHIGRRAGLATIERLEVAREAGLLTERVFLTDSSGLSVPMVVRTPVGPEAADSGASFLPDECGRRPLFLLLGGYVTGEDVALLVDDTRGAVMASVGYPYEGPSDLGPVDVALHVRAIRAALLETPGALRLALDHLMSRPTVDPDRVELVGVSLGGFFTPAAAAMDSRVRRLWLVHAAGKPRLVIDRALERSVSFAPLRRSLSTLANVALYGPWLGPERWVGGVSPRPIVLISAEDDTEVPRAAIEALFAAAGEPKEHVWLPGPHVRPTRGEVVEGLVDVVLSRASAQPLDDGGSERGGAECGR